MAVNIASILQAGQSPQPQLTDPLEQFQKGLALKNLMNQSQMSDYSLQQAVRMNALRNRLMGVNVDANGLPSMNQNAGAPQGQPDSSPQGQTLGGNLGQGNYQVPSSAVPYLLSGDPGMMEIGKSMVTASMPTEFQKDINGLGAPDRAIAINNKFNPLIVGRGDGLYNRGQDGSVALATGYAPGVAVVEAAKAQAKLPYEIAPAPFGQTATGQTQPMTVAQVLGQANGAAATPPNAPQSGASPPGFPTVSPAQQVSRDSDRLVILKDELSKTTDPKDQALLRSLITQTQNASASGQPFNTTIAGATPSSASPPLYGPSLTAKTEQGKRGDELAIQASKVYTDAQNAADIKTKTSEMQDLLQNFTPSKAAPMQLKMMEWRDAASKMGIPLVGLDEGDIKTAGSMQAMNKLSLQMAANTTRALGAREAAQIFEQMKLANPSMSGTVDGQQKVMGAINLAADLQINKATAMENWKQQHGGTTEGFEPSWTQNFSGQIKNINAVAQSLAPNASGAGSNAPTTAPVRIQGDDGYNALSSGSLFQGPDGVTRRKP